jgi:hypothetical protein
MISDRVATDGAKLQTSYYAVGISLLQYPVKLKNREKRLISFLLCSIYWSLKIDYFLSSFSLPTLLLRPRKSSRSKSSVKDVNGATSNIADTESTLLLAFFESSFNWLSLRLPYGEDPLSNV